MVVGNGEGGDSVGSSVGTEGIGVGNVVGVESMGAAVGTESSQVSQVSGQKAESGIRFHSFSQRFVSFLATHSQSQSEMSLKAKSGSSSQGTGASVEVGDGVDPSKWGDKTNNPSDMPLTTTVPEGK